MPTGSPVRKAGLQVLSSITEIEPEPWNQAVDALGGTIFHRHEWLRALTAGGMVDADEAHVLLRANGQVAALVPCLLTRRCPKLEMFRDYYLHSPFAGQPIAVVHSMYAQCSRLLAATDADREQLLEALEHQCLDVVGVDALMLPTVAAGDPLLGLLKSRGYALGLLSCTNVLPVRWRSFTEYLDSRTSAKRRNIRRTLRTAERHALTVAVHRDATALSTLADMVAQTARQHSSPLFFDGRFLRAIVTGLGERALTFVISVGDTTLLSCLALQHDGELVPWCVGLDYTLLEHYDHYNFLYAALIRYAIDQGLSTVNFGRSTYVIKRKYGCVQRPVYAAITGPARRRRDRENWLAAIDQRARAELDEVNLVVTEDDQFAVRVKNSPGQEHP